MAKKRSISQQINYDSGPGRNRNGANNQYTVARRYDSRNYANRRLDADQGASFGAGGQGWRHADAKANSTSQFGNRNQKYRDIRIALGLSAG